jgi:DNA polymerase V
MPLIALVDCNNFYASCERVFQPTLRGKAIVVLSNNDGCVIARSQEAKDMGIAMGAPWHLNQRDYKARGVYVRSSNYALYGDMSARVMEVLKQFTPQLEIYSIDESFLNLDGISAAHTDYARNIKSTVQQWTGIGVSIGIGPSKTLAKVANRYAKRHHATGGVYALTDPQAQETILSELALEDIWGIAHNLARRLRAVGLNSPLDLRNSETSFIRDRFGVVVERIARELRGESCLHLDDVTHDKKSIMVSRSFGHLIEHYQDLREAVVSYTSRAAEKMRRQHLAAHHISVFIETNRFIKSDQQYRAHYGIDLPVATSDTHLLAHRAIDALKIIWRKNYRYKKAGVMLLGLEPIEQVNDGLFDRADNAGALKRMKAMDYINQRFGHNTLMLAGAGMQPKWSLRRAFLSPSFTTHWDDLLKVD